MVKRSDGAAFEQEAVVDPDICVACGICVGSCPTATPFRRAGELIPGIDLPSLALTSLREKVDAAAGKLDGPTRLLVFGCDKALKVEKFKNHDIATVSMPCAGMLPPSFIDYVLSKKLADGVVVTGCRSGECHYRLGTVWLEERLEGKRDPRLRKRVPRERILQVWASATDGRSFERNLVNFKGEVNELAPYEPGKPTSIDEASS
jgi:coenzyme F420-reducing hydrogenase delta subunit